MTGAGLPPLDSQRSVATSPSATDSSRADDAIRVLSYIELVFLIIMRNKILPQAQKHNSICPFRVILILQFICL